MSTDESRKPAAHETLNEIADRLKALRADSGEGEQASPYASRLPPAHASAATVATIPAPGSRPQEPSAEHSAIEAPAGQERIEAAAGEPTPAAATASVSAPAAPARAAASAAASGTAPDPSPVPTPLVLARQEPPRLRTALLTYFPMLIAIISLGLSIFQGYLFHRSIDLSQRSIDLLERNVARGEYIRTCREVIETYFQVKQKVSVLMPAADRGNVAGASRVTEASRLDAQAAIAKFGGLGTYLANFQDPGTRARYTELTRTLTAIFESARATPLAEIDKAFEPADKLFTSMNDDCVRLARTMRL